MNRYLPLAVAGALVLGACGTIPGVSRQGAAGITDVDIEWCEPETEGARAYLCGVSWLDGKERQTVKLDVSMPDGTKLSYSSEGVKAFKGHEIRGAVEDAISDDIREVAPGIVDAVVDAIVGL